MTQSRKKDGDEIGDSATVQRRMDDAVRRALNTPPKPHKEMKKGKKKRQDELTASDDGDVKRT